MVDGSGKTKKTSPQSWAQERKATANLNAVANGTGQPPRNHRDASNSGVDRSIDPKIDVDISGREYVFIYEGRR